MILRAMIKKKKKSKLSGSEVFQYVYGWGERMSGVGEGISLHN